jgi:hypothetical protein
MFRRATAKTVAPSMAKDGDVCPGIDRRGKSNRPQGGANAALIFRKVCQAVSR